MLPLPFLDFVPMKSSLSHLLSDPQQLLTDVTWISHFIYCASSSFALPKKPLQKSPDFLSHLLYLSIPFPTPNVLFLIIFAELTHSLQKSVLLGQKILTVTKKCMEVDFTLF